MMKRLLIGDPIRTDEEHHQRLIKVIALAVFASDAISSTAYASDEVLLVLVPHGGMETLDHLIPIAFIVTILIGIVVFSYRQTIKAYPQGGGTYIVSRENLGETPALIAGSSILVDYVLTVAVSVSAGVAAITSAFPELLDHRVLLCLVFVVVMTLANLRGLKESGRLFAGPTYVYIVTLLGLIVVGLVRSYTGDLDPLPVDEERLNELTENGELLSGVGLFLLLRAFSSGAVALSGVEAIADGVPAFRKPEWRNASTTLLWMGVILGSMFFGVSWLAHRLTPTPSHDETLLSIMGKAVYGDGTALYYVLQFSTFAILILAANTAFADFPRLSSIIARDGFLPRQLANRGDRLVFSNGILLLATLASVLLVVFGGKTNALIPLYAVGVFTGFTLSQAGMVVYQLQRKAPGWRVAAIVSGVGAVATGLVLLVVGISKFTIGAWIPLVVIPAMVALLKAIGRHYRRVGAEIAVTGQWKPKRHNHTVVVLVGSLNKPTLQALTYARSLAPDRLVPLSVVHSPEESEELHQRWSEMGLAGDLHTVLSPYRDLTDDIVKFLDELDREDPDDIITVIIPEVVVRGTLVQTLHNQTALRIKGRLLRRPDTVVTSVPMIVEPSEAAENGRRAAEPAREQ